MVNTIDWDGFNEKSKRGDVDDLYLLLDTDAIYLTKDQATAIEHVLDIVEHCGNEFTLVSAIEGGNIPDFRPKKGEKVMEIRGKGWNPSKQETRNYAKWIALECCKEPSYAADLAIDSVIAALGMDGCNQDVITTLTIPLDEYRLLISDAQKKAKEEGCKEGREEAWDLARRIIASGDDCYTYEVVWDLFDTRSFWQILGTPVEEVLAKDKKYQEEKKALHIGDEVEFGVRAIDSKKYRGYITDFVPPNTVRVLTKELGTIRVKPEDCKKTGKHSEEIEKVMALFEEEKE